MYGTEFYMEAARLLMEIMRDQAPISGNSPGAVVRGRLIYGARRFMFGDRDDEDDGIVPT